MLQVLALAALILAPLGAQAADLVVWWDEAYYPQEDEALKEIIAAFEQGTGKQVEVTFYPDSELPTKIDAAIEAGQPPDFAYGGWVSENIARWAFNDRLVDLTDTIGSFVNLFDAQALDSVTLANGKTGKEACTGCPLAARLTTSTFGKSPWRRLGLPSTTFRRSGIRSGPSGATRSSRQCARSQAATTSGASA
jgi:hypothetical protein